MIDPNQRAGERAGEGAGVPSPAKAKAKPPPQVPAKAKAKGGGSSASKAGKGANYPIGSYKTLTGDPAKGAVPAGEYNVLESLMAEWEALVGYSVEPSTKQLLAMANAGIQTLRDFGQYMAKQGNAAKVAKTMPWANYGLSKDEYVAASSIFSTTYKKITGKDISDEALKGAFANPRDPTGGLLTGTQYQEQLMNDAAIQKQFGWVKYGLDYSAWTQQKLQFRSAFGRDISDTEAATMLQFTKAATGPNMSAVGQGSQQRVPTAGVGVAGSLVR